MGTEPFPGIGNLLKSRAQESTIPSLMHPTTPSAASTGIPGLDFILRGGFPRGTACLLRGVSGTGKTTLALQFLREGARQDERTLYVALSQSQTDLEMMARSHDWSLDGIDIYDASENLMDELAPRQRVVRRVDLELGELVDKIRDTIVDRAPERLVLDSVAVIRALSNQLIARYREELSLLVHVARKHDVTALFVDDMLSETQDGFAALVNSIIMLGHETTGFRSGHRQLRVDKVRAVDCLTGTHDFAIRTGGLEVFPRLQAPVDGATRTDPDEAFQLSFSSGKAELDALMGGTLRGGTTCLLAGESGTGKTTVASSYLDAALGDGHPAAAFLFDEHPGSFLRRATSMGMGLRSYAESGRFQLEDYPMGGVTSGEFSHALRRAVDEGARVLLIDSLTGYFHTLQNRELLFTQLHDMLQYTCERGVLTILVVAQHGLVGQTQSPVDVSYIADTVLLLRNFEANGAVHRAISVVKKRYGNHEKRIREIEITNTGIKLGSPLDEFRNVLTGHPDYMGKQDGLIPKDGGEDDDNA